MTAWLEIGLSNALVASVLALAAWLVTSVVRRADLAWALWLLVLLKLVSPPLASIPLRLTAQWSATEIATPANEARGLPTPLADDGRLTVILLDDGPPEKIAGRQVTPHGASPGDFPPIPSPSAPSTAELPASASAHEAFSASGRLLNRAMGIAERFPLLAPWIWLAGSVCWFGVAAIRIGRFNRFLKLAEPAPVTWQTEVEDLARRLGLRRAPRVRIVRRAVPPLVWGTTGKATMLLPVELVSELSADERATLFVHELAHLERRAHLVRWLELVALGLYWWHPVAWWARRRVHEAEEQCCDARVAAVLPRLTRCYAMTLLATIDFLADERPRLPLAASGFSQTRHVKRRLEMILSGRGLRPSGRPVWAAVLMSGILVLPWSIRAASADPAGTTVSIGAALSGADAKSIEQRLDRLEKMVQELTAEVRAIRDAQSADAPPVVLKTVPETGATDVDPKLTEIKVTFSKDMQNGSWSWTQRSEESFPGEGRGKIHYEKDKRTCVMPCKLEPGKTYWIGINSQRFQNFKDKAGHPATPLELTFTTKE